MNFLAHLYLSQNNTDILIGNFIADHVKGSQFYNYSKEIQQGILLHREIDLFTDTHPIVKQSMQRLHKRYRHYNGVIIDIFYDYFLAKNWSKYSDIPLQIFADTIYKFFQNIEINLPKKSRNFINYMVEYNILYNYQFHHGIEKVLHGMNYRSKGKSQMDLAINDLIENEADFEKDFNLFFEKLIQFTNEKLSLIPNS